MKIEVDTVKGFQDYLPPASLKRNAVRKIIEKHFKLYGFVPLETPVVEFDELMKNETLTLEEDEAVSDRFRLKDRAGRNLGLRYEFTFQLARIFKQNPNIKLPFRRYQIGEVFRDEPTGTGRFRQFVQCDADIIGDSSVNADADCLAMISDVLKELGVKAEIEVNNRKLLNAIIESVEISDGKGVMKEIDKIDKIGEDMLKSNLKKYADVNQIITLFKMMEKDINFFKENAFDGAEEMANLIEACKKHGVNVKFNPHMVRGLSYYTGNIFEVKVDGKMSIAAGGRYDNSVGKFSGREIPAVGISFGLERVSELAKTKGEQIPKLIIISLDKDKDCISLAKKLRKEGASCEVFFEKVGKALEYANALAVPYVIFVGANEVSKGKFKLKDMKSGDEKFLTEKQLLNMFEE
ncbi:MAG: histidine--tRNA ligase [archaeon]|nr:histidine--tRNA ligase [archaeon]